MEPYGIDIYDLLLSPLYILLIYFYANHYKNLKYKQPGKEYYRYFLPALFCKIIGGISLCLIYTYYYTEGGDATNYYNTSCTLLNVFLDGNFRLFWGLFSADPSAVAEVDAIGDYGYIFFNPHDNYAFFTVRLTLPFCFMAFRSFVPTTILLASASFIGIWKLYEVFVAHFPQLYKGFAVAIFFVPSVFFWGSGIIKDTYTLSATGMYTYGVYQFLILKNRRIKYLLALVGCALIIIGIKPYIFFALAPGSIVWNYFHKLKRIKNPLLRVMTLPVILVLTGAVILLGLRFFGDYLGEYSLDNILIKAVKTQQDLVRTQYGSNSYNIGKFDATLVGISSKIPTAINMALFRPYIWDARNPVMFISGLENLFMLGFSIFILIRVKFAVLIRSLFDDPLLIFSFLFALFFAFSVGLTTANYGALVRLKIPCIPFYLCSLFILYYINRESFRKRKRARK